MHQVASIYLLKVNNKSTSKICEICSKLTIKKAEKLQKGVYKKEKALFIVSYLL